MLKLGGGRGEGGNLGLGRGRGIPVFPPLPQYTSQLSKLCVANKLKLTFNTKITLLSSTSMGYNWSNFTISHVIFFYLQDHHSFKVC